jgi:hypothetical protein
MKFDLHKELEQLGFSRIVIEPYTWYNHEKDIVFEFGYYFDGCYHWGFKKTNPNRLCVNISPKVLLKKLKKYMEGE